MAVERGDGGFGVARERGIGNRLVFVIRILAVRAELDAHPPVAIQLVEQVVAVFHQPAGLAGADQRGMEGLVQRGPAVQFLGGPGGGRPRVA